MKLFFSMLTACTFGVVIAFGGITLFEFGFKSLAGHDSVPVQANVQHLVESDVNTAIIEESDQDPSFVSRFSRVFIYSAQDKEIIEEAENSLPRAKSVKISAPAYAVMDLDNNKKIIEKNTDKVLPLASVTKLVTAVVAKKLINSNQYITITKKVLDTYGNEAWLREGEKLKVGELLYPLLMVSSNDASEALASAYFAGRKDFIEQMNLWVNSIGAYHTHFNDPSGLSPSNVTTINDLSIITNWILKNDPEIFKITLLKSKTIRTHTWTNPTHFLNITSYMGGKNGYTPEANRTSVALFKLGKQEKIFGIFLLGSSNRDSDILDLLQEAIK